MTPPILGAQPVLRRIPGVDLRFGGLVGARLAANLEHWLLIAPGANPAMLQIFRDRDRWPVRNLEPFAGEFAGKYLASAVLGYRVTRDQRLRAHLADFVRELVATQAEDGYLGVFPRAYRLVGKTPRPDGSEFQTWDAWNHYHCMLGLLLWHEETGDPAALTACCRMGDLFCRRFLDTGVRLATTTPLERSEEMELAVIHSICLLYQRTGEERYLRLARWIEQDFEVPPSGDYVRTALAGLEFWQTPKPRWESLHDVQGIAELYLITGDPRYRRAFEQIWWSIRGSDRHNTGAFSTSEQATGNPYDTGGPIETCCTVAWSALSVDMLRLTGLPLAADELELSLLNELLGAQSPSGRWFTYDTPMDGVRFGSSHRLAAHAREGSPELNCCAAHGPRGLGMLSDWAVMAATDGLVLNYHGPLTAVAPTPSGTPVRLAAETNYPLGSRIALHVDPEQPETFTLHLRIPTWSRQSRLSVNGAPSDTPRPGGYAVIQRRWEPADVVRLDLDLSPRLWLGEREVAGKASIYRGPLLLTYDQRLNEMDPEDLPTLDAARLELSPTAVSGVGQPYPTALFAVAAADGRMVRLCDFASAGTAGNPYRSWLPIQGVARAAVPVARGPFGVDDSQLRQSMGLPSMEEGEAEAMSQRLTAVFGQGKKPA